MTFFVNIDNQSLEVKPNTSILQACEIAGVIIPRFCYHERLSVAGNCRMCLVEVDKMPKLQASCAVPVLPNMVIRTNTFAVRKAREGVLEFLLINHPLDCPICDQAGECHLQDLSYENGSAKTRTDFERRTFNKIDIGNNIQLHMTRCILCYRCVKVAEQITDGRVHGVINRGDHAEISTYVAQAIDNDFSGNVIDVCPVGALTDKTFRFKSRVWFTKPMQAHRDCDKCSGKVNLWYKGEEVLRVTGRKDQWGEIEEFICNTCRFDKKKTSDWVVEKPASISHQSVISANHYEVFTKPTEFKINIVKTLPIEEKTN